jgi:hypothetical protein
MIIIIYLFIVGEVFRFELRALHLVFRHYCLTHTSGNMEGNFMPQVVHNLNNPVVKTLCFEKQLKEVKFSQ